MQVQNPADRIPSVSERNLRYSILSALSPGMSLPDSVLPILVHMATTMILWRYQAWLDRILEAQLWMVETQDFIEQLWRFCGRVEEC